MMLRVPSDQEAVTSNLNNFHDFLEKMWYHPLCCFYKLLRSSEGCYIILLVSVFPAKTTKIKYDF